jgi:hypothetical protein
MVQRKTRATERDDRSCYLRQRTMATVDRSGSGGAPTRSRDVEEQAQFLDTVHAFPESWGRWNSRTVRCRSGIDSSTCYLSNIRSMLRCVPRGGQASAPRRQLLGAHLGARREAKGFRTRVPLRGARKFEQAASVFLLVRARNAARVFAADEAATWHKRWAQRHQDHCRVRKHGRGSVLELEDNPFRPSCGLPWQCRSRRFGGSIASSARIGRAV